MHFWKLSTDIRKCFVVGLACTSTVNSNELPKLLSLRWVDGGKKNANTFLLSRFTVSDKYEQGNSLGMKREKSKFTVRIFPMLAGGGREEVKAPSPPPPRQTSFPPERPCAYYAPCTHNRLFFADRRRRLLSRNIRRPALGVTSWPVTLGRLVSLRAARHRHRRPTFWLTVPPRRTRSHACP